MFDYVAMGNRMLYARMRKNYKQSEVAKVLNISQPAYSYFETGQREMTIDQLYLIADKLQVPVVWLLGIEKESDFSASDLLEIEEFKEFKLKKKLK
jgi:transcriptional regulator with XRE-family HTH domain